MKHLLTFRPTSGTPLHELTEPNGNVAGATDPFGYLVATCRREIQRI